VLVEQAELFEEIDLARAQAALERAEQQLADTSLDDTALVAAERSKTRAENRIRVAGRDAG
jgi:F-type H+-transporting ATPase subunit epsilon